MVHLQNSYGWLSEIAKDLGFDAIGLLRTNSLLESFLFLFIFTHELCS